MQTVKNARYYILANDELTHKTQKLKYVQYKMVNFNILRSPSSYKNIEFHQVMEHNTEL